MRMWSKSITPLIPSLFPFHQGDGLSGFYCTYDVPQYPSENLLFPSLWLLLLLFNNCPEKRRLRHSNSRADQPTTKSERKINPEKNLHASLWNSRMDSKPVVNKKWPIIQRTECEQYTFLPNIQYAGWIVYQIFNIKDALHTQGMLFFSSWQLFITWKATHSLQSKLDKLIYSSESQGKKCCQLLNSFCTILPPLLL